MRDRELDSLREHFDNADLSDAVDTTQWETEVDPNPMIVTSVRLPKSLLDWVREQAAAEHVKPTALIRRWVEDRQRADQSHRAGSGDDRVGRLEERVQQLEAVLLPGGSITPGAGR